MLRRLSWDRIAALPGTEICHERLRQHPRRDRLKRRHKLQPVVALPGAQVHRQGRSRPSHSRCTFVVKSPRLWPCLSAFALASRFFPARRGRTGKAGLQVQRARLEQSQVVNGLSGAEAFGQIAPAWAGATHPEDAIQDHAARAARRVVLGCESISLISANC